MRRILTCFNPWHHITIVHFTICIGCLQYVRSLYIIFNDCFGYWCRRADTCKREHSSFLQKSFGGWRKDEFQWMSLALPAVVTWKVSGLSNSAPVTLMEFLHCRTFSFLRRTWWDGVGYMENNVRFAVSAINIKSKVGMCGYRISVWFQFLKTVTEPKLKIKPEISVSVAFIKTELLIQIVNIWAILTMHSSRYGHCRTVNDHEIKLSVDTMR